MACITVKIEDYNKLDLVARARLAVHNAVFDSQTALIKDIALARKLKTEALRYISDSRALVKVGVLNEVYQALVVLAHDAEDIAEMRNHTTLIELREKLKKLNFRYAKVFAGLTTLLGTEEEEG